MCLVGVWFVFDGLFVCVWWVFSLCLVDLSFVFGGRSLVFCLSFIEFGLSVWRLWRACSV